MLLAGIILTVSLLTIILLGFWFSRYQKRYGAKKILLALNLILLAGLFFWGGNLLIPHYADAADQVNNASATGLGYLAAALAVGLATIGAGIGVGIAGSAAIGSISEKPEILGRTLIFVGLAEGVAIYGLIISIMILGRL